MPGPGAPQSRAAGRSPHPCTPSPPACPGTPVTSVRARHTGHGVMWDPGPQPGLSLCRASRAAEREEREGARRISPTLAEVVEEASKEDRVYEARESGEGGGGHQEVGTGEAVAGEENVGAEEEEGRGDSEGEAGEEGRAAEEAMGAPGDGRPSSTILERG